MKTTPIPEPPEERYLDSNETEPLDSQPELGPEAVSHAS